MQKLDWKIEFSHREPEHFRLQFKGFPKTWRGFGGFTEDHGVPFVIVGRVGFFSISHPEYRQETGLYCIDHKIFLPGSDAEDDEMTVLAPRSIHVLVRNGLLILKAALEETPFINPKRVLGDSWANEFNKEFGLWTTTGRFDKIAREMVVKNKIPKEAELTVKLFGRYA